MAEHEHESTVVAAGGSELAGRSSARGLRLETVGRWPMLFTQLRKIFKRIKPDVVLCNTGREARAAVTARGRLAKPRIVFRRGLCRDIASGPVRGWFYRRVDGFICNSRAAAQILERSHTWITEENMTVMYNPVPAIDRPTPEEADAWRGRFDITAHDFVVISVGRLDPDKGHVFLLQAFKTVLEREPTALLLIAGGGPERARLESAADRLGIGERVRFCGFVRDLGSLYAVADVMAQPSLPGYESFSNAALEALSFGLPLVATSVGGFPELISDGENGLLVPAADAGEMASAILRLVEDQPLRAGLAAAGRERALREFDPEQKAGELEDYLNSMEEAPVMKQPPPPPPTAASVTNERGTV